MHIQFRVGKLSFGKLDFTSTDSRLHVAKRLALVSVLASSLLAIANVLFGVMARSTSVVAAGVEFAGDVIASATVLLMT